MSSSDDIKKQNAQRALAILAIATVITLTIWLIVRLFGKQFTVLFQMLNRGDEDEIAAYLNAQGKWRGMLSIYLISILQVVSIFIPGMVIQLAAGLVYGWPRGFLMTYTGFVSGNVLVFLVARKLGSKINDLMPKSAKSNWLVDKINGANSAFVIGLACLIPGVPNGIIPYLASTTDLTPKKFAFAIAASCWIQILCNCIAGHFLVRGEYLFMILSFAVQILIIVLVASNREKVLAWGSKFTHRHSK